MVFLWCEPIYAVLGYPYVKISFHTCHIRSRFLPGAVPPDLHLLDLGSRIENSQFSYVSSHEQFNLISDKVTGASFMSNKFLSVPLRLLYHPIRKDSMGITGQTYLPTARNVK